MGKPPHLLIYVNFLCTHFIATNPQYGAKFAATPSNRMGRTGPSPRLPARPPPYRVFLRRKLLARNGCRGLSRRWPRTGSRTQCLQRAPIVSCVYEGSILTTFAPHSYKYSHTRLSRYIPRPYLLACNVCSGRIGAPANRALYIERTLKGGYSEASFFHV